MEVLPGEGGDAGVAAEGGGAVGLGSRRGALRGPEGVFKARGGGGGGREGREGWRKPQGKADGCGRKGSRGGEVPATKGRRGKPATPTTRLPNHQTVQRPRECLFET